MASIVLEVLRHCKFSPGMRLVYVSIVAYYEQYRGPVFPSLDTLARETGLSRPYILFCIKRLEAQGYLHIARHKPPGTHARNFYTPLYPWRPAQKVRKQPAQKVRKLSYPDLKSQDRKKEKDLDPAVPVTQPTFLMDNLGLTPGTLVYRWCLNDRQEGP